MYDHVWDSISADSLCMFKILNHICPIQQNILINKACYQRLLVESRPSGLKCAGCDFPGVLAGLRGASAGGCQLHSAPPAGSLRSARAARSIKYNHWLCNLSNFLMWRIAINRLRPRKKADISQTIFSNAFLERKYMNYDKYFTEVCS